MNETQQIEWLDECTVSVRLDDDVAPVDAWDLDDFEDLVTLH